MIERVTAIRFHEQAQGGATEPFLAACEREGSGVFDAFVKFSWQGCPPGGLIREVVSALLAGDVGLRPAVPVLVDIEIDLLEEVAGASLMLRKVVHRARGSVAPAFGSVHVGAGARLCTVDALPAECLDQATEIWAFDQLVMNPDRNRRKPNCLILNDNLFMIDHEKALNVAGVGAFIPAPWQDGGVLLTQDSEYSHIFATIVRGRARTIDRLHEAWRSLRRDQIDGYVELIPDTWMVGNDVASEIVGYLTNLQENVDAAFERLRQVMV